MSDSTAAVHQALDRWSGESEQPGLGTAEPKYVGVSG